MSCAAAQPGFLLSSEAIGERARALGFDCCGVAQALPFSRAGYLREWLAAGRHAGMEWMARDPQRRVDPRLVLPGAKSVIVVGMNYHQPPPPRRGRIAAYALGEDYHSLLQERLLALQEWLAAAGGGEHKFYVDTGPVLEKGVAQEARLGWQGKSTMLISQSFGPWLLLGEILTTLDLPPARPAPDRCGSCERCLKACPTGAIVAPYQLDARRCVAYLTIELKGSIPEEFRPLIGDRIYGCDDCLTACPWNRFARLSTESRFAATEATSRYDLRDLLALTPEQFKRSFSSSPIARVKRRGLLRNVCVALGNCGNVNDLPSLHQAALDVEPLVREHASWAISQLESRLAQSKTPFPAL